MQKLLEEFKMKMFVELNEQWTTHRHLEELDFWNWLVCLWVGAFQNSVVASPWWQGVTVCSDATPTAFWPERLKYLVTGVVRSFGRVSLKRFYDCFYSKMYWVEKKKKPSIFMSVKYSIRISCFLFWITKKLFLPWRTL